MGEKFDREAAITALEEARRRAASWPMTERNEHVFADKPDARQAGDIKPSRFRPRYRALDPDEKALHDTIKVRAEELEKLINSIPDCGEIVAPGRGRCKALALTKLEESIMWAIKGLTA